MAKKVSELDAITTLADGDLVEVSQNAGGGSYTSKKINLVGNAANIRSALGLEIGADVAAYVKHNFSGSAAPTAGDDSADGYAVGSIWIDTTADEAYRCVDATEGAAVWIETTLQTAELGSMAVQDADDVDISGGDIDGITTLGLAGEHDNGTVSTATEIDWANGNYQKVTMGDSITFTFANPVVGRMQLKVIQDGTGSRTPTLPSGKWPGGTPGSFSTAAGAIDILDIYYDGAAYYYQLTTAWA